MNERSSTLSFGLGETILRWVGRHPFRTWLVAWLAFTWGWLAVQLLIGVPWGSLAPMPPTRNQIRYADMQGKRMQSGIVMAFPDRVLAADPPVGAMKLGSDLQFGEHDGGGVIATAQTLVRLDFGWPQPLFSGRLWSAWDVTDPERGFVPAVDVFPRPRRGSENAGLAWISTDGTTQLRLHLLRPAVWSPVVLALLPIAPVIALWIGYEWRQHRRRRLGACLQCGHERGPGATSQRCTECGSLFISNGGERDESTMKRAFRAVRLPAMALLLWMALTCAAVAAFWLTSSEMPTDEKAIRDSAEHAAAYAKQEGKTPDELGLRASERLIGWPWPFLTFQRWRWYTVNPDATYAPVPVDLDIEFRDDHPDWDWHVMSDDPLVLNWYFVNWRPGMLTLAVTAFVAGNILCAMQLMRGMRRARSAQRR